MLQNFLIFLDWLKTKILLTHKSPRILFEEGQIWWVSIGANIGTEIFGKGDEFARPVIIFKKISADSFLGIPLTSKLKFGSWYVSVAHNGIIRTAILAQARALDSRRLIRKMGRVSDNEFKKIKERFIDFYGS